MEKLKQRLDKMLEFPSDITKIKWQKEGKIDVFKVNKTMKLDKKTITQANTFVKLLEKYNKSSKYVYPKIDAQYKIIKICTGNEFKYVFTFTPIHRYIFTLLTGFIKGYKNNLTGIVKTQKDLLNLRFIVVEYVKDKTAAKTRKNMYIEGKVKSTNPYSELISMIELFNSNKKTGHIVISKIDSRYFIAGSMEYKRRKQIMEEQLKEEKVKKKYSDFEVVEIKEVKYISKEYFQFMMDVYCYKYRSVECGYNIGYYEIDSKDISKKEIKKLHNRLWTSMNLSLVKNSKTQGILLLKIGGENKCIITSKHKGLHTILKDFYEELLDSKNNNTIHKILRKYPLSKVKFKGLKIDKGKSLKEMKSKYEVKYKIGRANYYITSGRRKNKEKK